MNYHPDMYGAAERRSSWNLARGRVYTIDLMFRQPMPDALPLLLVRAHSHIYGDVVWVYLPRSYCLYFDDRDIYIINSGMVLYGILFEGWTSVGEPLLRIV
jgi:hypothetical protein